MIDLHIHTTNSDGELSVKEILKMSEEKGIKAISFCDHNVLGAYKEIKNMKVTDYFSGKIIPGIEFNMRYKGKLFHILGYNFDIEKLEKSKYIDRRTEKELIEEEENILEFLKSVCKKLDIKLSENLKICSSNEPANDIIKADMLKHEENNEILDKILGKDRNISFWRGHVTNPESPFFIDFTKDLPTPEIIANEIHECGGIVILPHVFEYKFCDNKQFLKEIYNLGILDGIECIHTKHSYEQIMYLREYCKDKKLIMTGGSDFHNIANHNLGYGSFGKIEITDEYYFGKF